MMQAKTLRISEQIYLKEVEINDAERIFRAIDTYRADLHTWLPFVDNLKKAADEEAFLKTVLDVPYEQRNLTFIIEKDDVFCGLIGFVLTDRMNHKTEIGYWLIPPARGQGIITACARFLCEWSFTERGMNRIQIKCAVGNRPSNAVPLRLGFRHEGVERDGELQASGHYADINMYSLLKREFKEKTK